jgi:hypothetical protein
MRWVPTKSRSKGGTFLMTPKQHRERAALLRGLDPKQFPNAAQKADSHENVAKMIEGAQAMRH